MRKGRRIYLFKVTNRKISKKCEICSKIWTFILIFHRFWTGKCLPGFNIKVMTSFWYLYCLLWTCFFSFSSVSIVDFEQVNISYEVEGERVASKIDQIWQWYRNREVKSTWKFVDTNCKWSRTWFSWLISGNKISAKSHFFVKRRSTWQ